MQERFMRAGEPIHPEQRERRRSPRWLLSSLGRLLAWVAAVSAICIGLGLLIGHFKHSDPSRSVPVALYIGGATLMLVSSGGALGSRNVYRGLWDRASAHDEMVRRYQASRGAYVVVGFVVIAFGVFFDWLL
jgi:hypothetical protein